MKYLSIIRHAKAKRPEQYDTDFERPLTSRGHVDAGNIAKILTQIEPAADWFISSPAARTYETTQHLLSVTEYHKEPIWDQSVYLASANTLLKSICNAPTEAEHIVLVGHNPGMEDLAIGLCSGTPHHLSLRMPTAAIAHLSLELFQWNQVRWGCGQLKLLLPPKLLRK